MRSVTAELSFNALLQDPVARLLKARVRGKMHADMTRVLDLLVQNNEKSKNHQIYFTTKFVILNLKYSNKLQVQTLGIYKFISHQFLSIKSYTRFSLTNHCIVYYRII